MGRRIFLLGCFVGVDDVDGSNDLELPRKGLGKSSSSFRLTIYFWPLVSILSANEQSSVRSRGMHEFLRPPYGWLVTFGVGSWRKTKL